MPTEKGPTGVSVVCRKCGCTIPPHALKEAAQARIEKPDGTYRLQYDHRDECPAMAAARANAANPATTFVRR